MLNYFKDGEFKDVQSCCDHDLTFVVQGPVLSHPQASTESTLLSVRAHFPKCKILLSTWSTSGLQNLTFDELIVSADPGPVATTIGDVVLNNNTNRQIRSTAEGLKRVETPYAVKLRSDAVVTGRGFMALGKAFPWRDSSSSVTEQRIVVSREFTRSSRSFVPMGFHPSDMFQFGLTADLQNYWAAPFIVSDDETEDRTSSSWFSMFDALRLTTEQHLFTSFLRRNGRNVNFTHYDQLDRRTADQSEAYLLNNFLPGEPEIIGIEHPKFRGRAHLSLREDCLGIREFASWYVGGATASELANPLGPSSPQLSKALRAERLAREFLKRSSTLKALYAKYYLSR